MPTKAEKFVDGVAIVIGSVGFVAVCSALFALPVKWTWNGVMPAVFHLPEVTWLQAWCLSFLTSILFKTQQKSNS